MKDNIDLTENRDFADNSSGLHTALEQLFNTHLKTRVRVLPWDIKEITSDVDLYFDGISDDDYFPTGSKKEIIRKLGVKNACSENHCDRCGARVDSIPWLGRFSSLCIKCNEWINKEYGSQKDRIPWDNSIRIITTSNIFN